MTTLEEIQERLAPKHIEEAVKEIAENSITPEEIKSKKKDLEEKDPRLKNLYSFKINWKSPDGKIYEGFFTNKILTLKDRIDMGILQLKISQGHPLTSLDDEAAELIRIFSHLLISLTNKPEWAENLSLEVHGRLLHEIYREVLLHEGTFHGGIQPQE